jgi:hypothetical protein
VTYDIYVTNNICQYGCSDQKIEIEIIFSSPLDTSCELGKDSLV